MKVKELQKELIKNKLDGAILFSQDSNFFYFVQQNIENSFIIIPAEGNPTIFISPLDKIKSKFKVISYKHPIKELEAFLKKNKIKTLGINEGSVVVRKKKNLSKLMKTSDVENILTNLRKTKTKEEIATTKKAIKLTEQVLKKIVKHFNFKTEGEIVQFIRKEALENNCELAFEPKVASGKNASIPHYSNSQKIKQGFLIIDMGLKYKGYCADITRTLYVGTPSEKELELYNDLLRIQKEAIKKVRPGVKTKELDSFVRTEMGENAKYFIHALGHGMGIKIHEDPKVGPNADDILEEGHIITIEPGIYNNFGIRIEDDVLVTKKGCELLTTFPKELIIIPKV